MSLLRKKHLLQPFKGAIGRTVVVKQYATKTVITAYPNKSKVISSPKQKAWKSIFTEAVAYARGINNDLNKKQPMLRGFPLGNLFIMLPCQNTS